MPVAHGARYLLGYRPGCSYCASFCNDDKLNPNNGMRGELLC